MREPQPEGVDLFIGLALGGVAFRWTLGFMPNIMNVTYGPNPLHFGDLRLPPGEGPHPLVVAIHGGFWRNRYSLDHLGFMCEAITRAGYAGRA